MSVKRCNKHDLDFLIQIYEANHENLNRFVGFCVDAESTILIVWNYCAKGNLRVTTNIFCDCNFNVMFQRNFLQNTLQEPDIELDYAFKSSIMRDIIQVSCYRNQELVEIKRIFNY